jgi:hypothetical protein
MKRVIGIVCLMALMSCSGAPVDPRPLLLMLQQPGDCSKCDALAGKPDGILDEVIRESGVFSWRISLEAQPPLAEKYRAQTIACFAGAKQVIELPDGSQIAICSRTVRSIRAEVRDRLRPGHQLSRMEIGFTLLCSGGGRHAERRARNLGHGFVWVLGQYHSECDFTYAMPVDVAVADHLGWYDKLGGLRGRNAHVTINVVIIREHGTDRCATRGVIHLRVLRDLVSDSWEACEDSTSLTVWPGDIVIALEERDVFHPQLESAIRDYLAERCGRRELIETLTALGTPSIQERRSGPSE